MFAAKCDNLQACAEREKSRQGWLFVPTWQACQFNLQVKVKVQHWGQIRRCQTSVQIRMGLEVIKTLIFEIYTLDFYHINKVNLRPESCWASECQSCKLGAGQFRNAAAQCWLCCNKVVKHHLFLKRPFCSTNSRFWKKFEKKKKEKSE